MRIQELLTVPHLAGMNMIAGATGQNREVLTVNMMDAPDIIHFLNPNELLVTTAYHLKDHPHMLTDLIRTMAEQGCAGLGIKTKRYIQEVPEEAIELANELALPIIELPLELSLGEIVNHTLRVILDKRARELSLILETHNRFTDIMMKGQGIPPLLQNLSELIDLPIHLFDQHFNTLSPYLSNSNFFSLPDSLQAADFSIPAPYMSYIIFSIVPTKLTYSLFPVHISEKKIGFLMIKGEIQKLDHLTALTIEPATSVISFALMKENAVKQHDRSIRNDFFLHFLDDAFSSPEEIINRAAEFSLQNNQAYICAVGKIDEENLQFSFTQHQQKVDEIFEFIEGELSASSNKIHFFTKGDICILLYEVENQTINTGAYTEASLRQLQEKIYATFKNTASFGVSNFSHTFLHMKNAFKEGVDALAQGKLLKKTQYIQTYHTKDVMELLRLIPREDLSNFYASILKGFTEKNLEEEQSLLHTLFVYFEANCQIAETAKRLFIHRNTVIYRIDKCEEILGTNLKDPETSLQIRIALRIKALLEI